MTEPNDHEWLEARERGDDISHVPERTRAPYDELGRLLAALPAHTARPGWKRRVLAALDDPPSPPPPPIRRRTRSWAIAGAAAAAVTIAVVLVMWPGDRRPVEPIATTEIHRGSNVYRGDNDANVGDTLVVRAEAGRPIELRIYGDTGELLARCNDSAGCTVERDGKHRLYRLELVLRLRGEARTMLFIGDGIPAVSQNLDADVAAAEQAGAKVRQIGVAHVQ